MSVWARFRVSQGRTNGSAASSGTPSDQAEPPDADGSGPAADDATGTRTRSSWTDSWTGPFTAPFAAIRSGTRASRRRRRADWGAADDVDLRPAPPPDARPSAGSAGSADDAGSPPATGNDLRGVAFGQGPFGQNGHGGPADPASPDAPTGAPSLSPPWRRPATPPWGFTAPGHDEQADTAAPRTGDTPRPMASAPAPTSAPATPAPASEEATAPASTTAAPAPDQPAPDRPAPDQPAPDRPASAPESGRARGGSSWGSAFASRSGGPPEPYIGDRAIDEAGDHRIGLRARGTDGADFPTSASAAGGLASAGAASSALVTGSAPPMSSSPDDRRAATAAPTSGVTIPDSDRPGSPAPADPATTTITEDPMTAPSSSLPTHDPGTRAGTTSGPTEPPAPSTPPAAPATPSAATGGPRRIDRSHVPQDRLGIDDVTPVVSQGRFPSKAVVGEIVPVTAAVWREGHDAVAATIVWQRAAGDQAGEAPGEQDGPDARRTRMVPGAAGTDTFAGRIVPDAEGLWSFRVDAWSDPWATWRHAVEVKVGAGQGPAELANDLEVGARLLDRGAAQIEDRPARRAAGDSTSAPATIPIDAAPALALARTLTTAASTLRDTDLALAERLAGALSEPVHRTMTEQPVRDLLTRGRTHHVVVERPVALAGSWYEFFPRSTGGRDADGVPVHGTFATAVDELDRVAAMGFDVAYVPPIHPIGAVNRKGRNNAVTAEDGDVGTPWAIGSADGGHDAVHPALGTIDDFDAFVAHARELGLEIALDLALQCAPDHPWVAEHPEWFVVRPDGTIAYAENPPKKYQDIYPLNFDTDPDGLYAEVLRVVEFWMDHGVRIFRVDNPHTKPPDFWCWLIAEVHRRDPGVVFLAEAFTRPARLFGLAKAGFSQSYTYFTWRTGKEELREFFELHRDRIDEARPNCFVNTPDILHESLQVGGPGMFAIRAALAATLSPTWGVYSGFELFEHAPVRAGSEEYLDSEKYELRPRDFAGALASGRSLAPWLTRLNQIRRTHPALRQIRTLRFHDVDNDALLAFSKVDPRTGDTVLCVVTLDPFAAQDGTLRLDMPALGLGWEDRFWAVDEVSGQTFDWGQSDYVRLEPWRDVAHIVSVNRR